MGLLCCVHHDMRMPSAVGQSRGRVVRHVQRAVRWAWQGEGKGTKHGLEDLGWQACYRSGRMGQEEEGCPAFQGADEWTQGSEPIKAVKLKEVHRCLLCRLAAQQLAASGTGSSRLGGRAGCGSWDRHRLLLHRLLCLLSRRLAGSGSCLWHGGTGLLLCRRLLLRCRLRLLSAGLGSSSGGL